VVVGLPGSQDVRNRILSPLSGSRLLAYNDHNCSRARSSDCTTLAMCKVPRAPPPILANRPRTVVSALRSFAFSSSGWPRSLAPSSQARPTVAPSFDSVLRPQPNSPVWRAGALDGLFLASREVDWAWRSRGSAGHRPCACWSGGTDGGPTGCASDADTDAME
jgi:hypothetical protein